MNDRDHWDQVYGSKSPEAVSWYSPHLETSLQMVRRLTLPPSARVIDVGGGASTFASDLLAEGFERPTVLDISKAAVDAARTRMGADASKVDWIVGDVTRARLPERRFHLWHDRAVFHFLTRPEDRVRYVQAVLRSVVPGGHVMVATFGPRGPEQCSGLDVVRYDADALHGEFGQAFEKLSSTTELHTTPWGSEQEFLYCLCRRVGSTQREDGTGVVEPKPVDVRSLEGCLNEFVQRTLSVEEMDEAIAEAVVDRYRRATSE